ncbi:hypothetical protein ZEAMMB73_Zm00001d035934 [Zea mays]|uniref:Uncharacterized protein n=2 Tax=Andropogoneae TaxID=147429 RepID=A0A1D6LJS3_MAIZE|nr:hypothetical protein ZEAMMB73_Zm00001d035934 [Zea mays]
MDDEKRMGGLGMEKGEGMGSAVADSGESRGRV